MTYIFALNVGAQRDHSSLKLRTKMADYDPLKAAREILVGYTEIRNAMAQDERYWSEQYARAEQHLNRVRKALAAWNSEVVVPQQEKVYRLEREQDH